MNGFNPQVEARRQPRRMSDEDRSLSMRISPRALRPEDNEGLRSLLVHRLAEGDKGVWRRSLRDEDQVSFYCEPCDRWWQREPLAEEISCGKCSRVYRVEFAVLEEVVDDDDPDGDAGEHPDDDQEGDAPELDDAAFPHRNYG